MKVFPLAALMFAASAGPLAAQSPRPAGTARITVTARVIPAQTAQQSARIVRQTLDAPMPAGRTTRRDGVLWVSVERPRSDVRRVTVNYLAN